MLLNTKTLSVTSPVIPNLLGVSALVASKISGTEGINQLFEYTIELRTDLALYGQAITDQIKLDEMAGRELTAHIALEGNGSFLTGALGVGKGERQISGVISKAEYLREEGRQHIFRVTLKPWLYIASLRSDCRIFQNKTVVEVLDSVLSYYPFSTKKRLIENYPSIDCFTQYNETDFVFVERLCQEYGINYHFEHGDGVHHLVLSDHNGAFEQNTSAAYHQISYYPIGHKVDEEYIHSFTDISQVVTGQFTTTDYDYTRPKAKLAVTNSDPMVEGEPFKQEQYVYHTTQGIDHSQANAGAAQNTNQDDETRGKALARVRMQMLRQHGHRSQGEGHLRGVVPASGFTLRHHPRARLNTEYIVLNAKLEIEDIGQSSQYSSQINQQSPKAIASGSTLKRTSSGEEWKVHVAFTVQTSKEIIRPDITYDKPLVNGIESAIVVGPKEDTAASNIYTDYLGRIKIQFPWDRLGKSDQTSSIWVRTDAPWAGNQLGAMFIPRIGEEVLVSFVGGDIDQPLVTGRVYNENNLPPWALPSQQALSGFRSRELTDGGGNAAGGRSNHIILDDTNEKIQVQLKSDHQDSQLSLGHVTRIEDNAGRKDARGEGFELRTDGKGAVRAKDGMLITTEGRSNASAHITDMGETTARLQESQSQHESLGDLAKQMQAQDSDASQEDVSKALDKQVKDIKGGEAGARGERPSTTSPNNSSSTERSRSGKNIEDKSFPEFSQPHLVLASPAGIASTTPKTTSMHSGKHIALTSAGHTSVTANQSFLAVANKGVRLFVSKLGMKLVSAAADIDFKALKTNINAVAKLNITHIANTITVNAKEEVLVNGAGSYTSLKAGAIENGTDGAYTVHAANHSYTGPKSLPTPTMSLNHKTWIEIRRLDDELEPVANSKYKITFENGEVRKGTLDKNGFVRLENVPSGDAKVEYFDKVKKLNYPSGSY